MGTELTIVRDSERYQELGFTYCSTSMDHRQSAREIDLPLYRETCFRLAKGDAKLAVSLFEKAKLLRERGD